MSLADVIQEMRRRRTARQQARRDRVCRATGRPDAFVADLTRKLEGIVGAAWNWDGFNGLPPRDDAMDLFARVFGTPGTVLTSGLVLGYLGVPEVLLESDGTITLALGHETDRRLSIRFVCDNVAVYTKSWEDCETSESGVIRFSGSEGIAAVGDLLDWIATN
jgi:hypothetical protein